jgi:putative ABC transport system substrate-binding protein
LRYLFDGYVLDTERRELRHGAGVVSLEPQVFDILEYLIRNREHVVSKDDLFASIWNGRLVSESALSTRINAARGAIGDNGEEQRLIRTVFRKGFRFVGAVCEEQKRAPGRAGRCVGGHWKTRPRTGKPCGTGYSRLGAIAPRRYFGPRDEDQKLIELKRTYRMVCLPEQEVVAMKRRDFLALLASAVTSCAWPLAARAQQPAKLPTIGFLGAGTPLAWSQWIAAFVRRLPELGWIEGSNVAIEVRWGEGRSERFAEIAAEFVQLKVDVIVTGGTAPVIAAKNATSVIPIVFAAAGDPVATGLVASLARPGGNVTGLSIQHTDLGGKRLGLLREVVPGLRRLAIMANASAPNALLEMGEVQAAARTLGLEVATFDIRRAEDIAPAFEALKGRADALYLVTDPLVSSHRIRINTLALDARLPTASGLRDYVEDGGLMSYGANLPGAFRRAADFVDKILRGAKPADIPVEQPTKFDFVVNLTTAKALGLTVSSSVLARADELIE